MKAEVRAEKRLVEMHSKLFLKNLVNNTKLSKKRKKRLRAKMRKKEGEDGLKRRKSEEARKKDGETENKEVVNAANLACIATDKPTEEKKMKMPNLAPDEEEKKKAN